MEKGRKKVLRLDLIFRGYYTETLPRAGSVNPLLDKNKRDIKESEGCLQRRRNATVVPLYGSDAALSSFSQRFQKSLLEVP